MTKKLDLLARADLREIRDQAEGLALIATDPMWKYAYQQFRAAADKIHAMHEVSEGAYR